MVINTTAARDMANRRRQLQRWIDHYHDGLQVKFISTCASYGHEINQGELSGLLKKKSFGEKKARALETQARMPSRFLDSTDAPQMTQAAGMEPVPAYRSIGGGGSDLDPWTLEAISIMRTIREDQREGAVANLRTYVQNLGPPRNGQTLPVAA